MSAQNASQQGQGNIVVQAEGDNIHVQIGLPHLKLVPVEARLSEKPLREIDLLNPAFQAVPLVGRESDLRFLHQWLTSEPSIAVTAMVGPGGSGKTRLALEFLQQLPADWQGGFLTAKEAARFTSQQNLSQWSWQKPTLVVADYAAMMTATLSEWFAELADHSAPSRPLRILLLERHADAKTGWYCDLADGTWSGRKARDLFWPDEPRRVAPLDEMVQRRQVLEAGLQAAATFAPPNLPSCRLPTPADDAWFDQRLAAGQWSDPLLLLMAAVIAASKGVHAALALSRPDLATELAVREKDRIRKTAQTPAAGELLLHLYACVTLCGGLPRDQAVEVAGQEFAAEHKQYPGGPGQAVDDLVRYLGVPYPSRAAKLPPLLPDLLGEALLPIALAAKGAAVTARLSHIAAEGVASSLIRSAQDFGPAGERWPLEWLQSLIVEGQTDLAILLEIESALPNETLILRKLAVEVTRTLVEKLSGLLEQAETVTQASQAYLARLWNNLSVRQSDMGQRGEALASVAEAVRHYRALAEANPDAFLPDLAGALNNLANRQSEMGQRGGALASIVEAVPHYRTLAEANPDAFLPDLAMSLNNLSNRQSEMGERAEALASIVEAVRHFRALAEANPHAFLPQLAGSLNNLANMQSRMGRGAEALASIEEAVRHYRTLAEANPDAFLPNLAMALNNQSNRQSAMGQRGKALASIVEAASHYRALAEANPDAFLPSLAMALNNQANAQSGMGQRRQALASIAEAVRIRRALSEANPDAFLPSLAMTLNNQANMQSEMGQRGEALASIAESVRILSALADASPDAFLPDLAISLNNLSTMQSEMGQHDKALAAITEAVRIRHALAEANPDAFLPDLATSLNNQATRQGEVGQSGEALTSITEAVRIRRTLAEADPDAFLPNLATALNNLATRQSEMGQSSEALSSIAEAIRHYRTLAGANPDAFLPNLAASLNNQATMQGDMGQHDQALASIAEAVRHYRTLAETNPDAFLPSLATSLYVQGNCLDGMDRLAEARDAARESLRVLAPFFLQHPGVFDELAGTTCQDYAQRCEQLGAEPEMEILNPYMRLFAEGESNE